MAITIRDYQLRDFAALIECMTGLQEHVSRSDPLHLQLPGDEVDEELYSRRLLAKVAEHQGAIFVAVDDNRVIGCVAGIIDAFDELDSLCSRMVQQGRICELHVMEPYRNRGVGLRLIEAMEHYLIKQGCLYLRVECFAPNLLARDFYRKRGYAERYVDLIKMVDGQ